MYFYRKVSGLSPGLGTGFPDSVLQTNFSEITLHDAVRFCTVLIQHSLYKNVTLMLSGSYRVPDREHTKRR
jgi:hypothetical protein